MATTKKTPAHVAALVRAGRLEQDYQAAQVKVDEAKSHLDDLLDRRSSGDTTVSGPDLTTARETIDLAQIDAARAERLHHEARVQAAEQLAEYTATQVREGVRMVDLDKIAEEAAQAIEAALTRVSEAFANQDTASDAAGHALAEAGIAPGEWVSGIRYVRPGSMPGGLGVVLPGAYNVEVETTDGGTKWISSAGRERNTKRALTLMVDAILDRARECVPVSKRASGGIVF